MPNKRKTPHTLTGGGAYQGKATLTDLTLPPNPASGNTILALDIRRRGKPCPYNLSGRERDVVQTLRCGGVHTLVHRIPDLWEVLESLRERRLRIGRRSFILGGREYFHFWLLERVKGAVEVGHAAGL
ncbi:MAG: hypothetical protein WAZ18_05445 [Alphaproteobacteria bacterium]